MNWDFLGFKSDSEMQGSVMSVKENNTSTLESSKR